MIYIFYKIFKQIKLIHIKIKIKGEKFYRNQTNIFKVWCLKKSKKFNYYFKKKNLIFLQNKRGYKSIFK
jgi:hypothetical protein